MTEPSAGPTLSVMLSTTAQCVAVWPSTRATPTRLGAAPEWGVRTVETAGETRSVRSSTTDVWNAAARSVHGYFLFIHLLNISRLDLVVFRQRMFRVIY